MVEVRKPDTNPNATATNIVGNRINFTTDTGTAVDTSGYVTSGDYLFDTNGTTTTTDLSYSGFASTPAYSIYKGGNQFYHEWNKWRAEFIRELLREQPLGIVDYKQERFYDTKTNTMRVKVTLEYVPEIPKKGVRK
jgi:hypothetical protein